MADMSLVLHDESVKARFWAKVERRGTDECWPWLGAKGKDGRGSFWMGLRVTAPNASLRFHTGVIPEKGIFACHTCDNPNCVNPAHLWWGTAKDNAQDASRKGRVRGQSITHCPNGHEYSPENTRANTGGTGRRCRICAHQTNLLWQNTPEQKKARADAQRRRKGRTQHWRALLTDPFEIVASRLTNRQRKLISASAPDDITGEEGLGVEISGAAYRTAKTLRDMGIGDYTHGSPFGDMYWNSEYGLKIREAVARVPGLKRTYPNDL